MNAMTLFALVITSSVVLAVENPDLEKNANARKGVHYRAQKEVNFEQLLIQGDIQRPEVSVVTGNEVQGTDGLLRLRENFVDRIAQDFGEEGP